MVEAEILERPKGRFITERKGPAIVLVCSPKGGVGKTTIARNFLVRAAQTDIEAIGIDLDRQCSLTKWAERRAKICERFDDFVPIRVERGDLDDWRTVLDLGRKVELIVIDTAPSVEDHLIPISRLAQRASLTIVPTGTTTDDTDSTVPWMRTLAGNKIKAVFCLNRVNRRTKSFQDGRATLMKAGPICPIALPLVEDIHVHTKNGLTPLDVARASGVDEFENLWEYVRREVSL